MELDWKDFLLFNVIGGKIRIEHKWDKGANNNKNNDWKY